MCINILKYKGYTGSVDFSEEDKRFFGKVLGIDSLIFYEGKNSKELIDDFHDAIDDYLKMCEELKFEIRLPQSY